MSPLGKVLHAKIKAKETTRKELAESAGITTDAVARIIRGQIKRPPLARLQGFAKVLGCKTSELQSLVN